MFYDFIEALEDRHLSPIANPVRTKLFLSEPAFRTRYLTDDEETKLKTVMSAEHWPKVLVSLLTGLDRGAEFGLRWEAVDLQARTIAAERRKGRRKGAISVTVPINDELLGVLRSLPSRLASAWMFPNASDTGPLDATASFSADPLRSIAGLK